MKSSKKAHLQPPYGDEQSMKYYSQTGIHYNMFKNKKAYKLYQANKFKEAERLLQNAQSDFDISILASIHYRTSRYESAAKLFKQAIRLNSTNHFHYNNLGAVYKDTNQPALAIKCFESALSLRPDFVEALYNLASCHQLAGNFTLAEELFKQAIEIQPDFTVARNNLACIYIDRGEIEKAIYKFDDIITREPTNYAIMSNKLFALNYLNLDEHFVFTEHKKFYDQYQKNQTSLTTRPSTNQNTDTNTQQPSHQSFVQETFQNEYINQYRQNIDSNPIIDTNSNPSLNTSTLSTIDNIYYDHTNEPDYTYNQQHNQSNTSLQTKKIRVGYLSPDFRLHSVSYFAYPIIKYHDKSKFDIYCYSDVANDDQVSGLIASNSIYKNVYRFTNDQIVSQIQQDKIDILIDLAGHSAHNRLPLFIQQPAKKQVTYLGYPNTTGIPNIQYKFTDNFVDPVEYKSDELYTEKLIRLSKIFLTYYPGYPTPTLTSYTPPITINHFATYGSFNNRAKINSHVLDTWAQILYHDKNARLILKSSINSDEYKQQSINAEFEKRNIDPTRITIYPFTDFHSHLALYQKIDIALDTFPYSGTTTTAEALWSGVPVITLLGQTHKSRVSADILFSLNLHACVALSQDDYINRAVSMAHNHQFVSIWRANHNQIMLSSVFMNYQYLTHEIEHNYVKINNDDI